jgi:hypothetical protein
MFMNEQYISTVTMESCNDMRKNGNLASVTSQNSYSLYLVTHTLCVCVCVCGGGGGLNVVKWNGFFGCLKN